MAQSLTSATYYGFWIDWNIGSAYGATITLPRRGGTLLLAFTAVFTSFVLGQLWTIITFLIYHARAKNAPQSALTHQRQAILRNSGPLLASWIFMKQAYHWYGKERTASVRSFGWMAVALGFTILSALVATFSASASSKASTLRVVNGDNCGFWSLVPLDPNAPWLYFRSINNDTSNAVEYARNCYGTDLDSSAQCQRYVKRQLTWSASTNVACPFQSEICRPSNQSAFSMTTDLIDSLFDLGINSHSSDRLYLQKRAVCSCLQTEPYTEIQFSPGTGDLKYYYYGPYGGYAATQWLNPQTWSSSTGYSLLGVKARAGLSDSWVPIPALNRTDADVSIIFISSLSLVYKYANSDDLFGTNVTSRGLQAVNEMGVIACTDQYRVCNPATESQDNKEGNCSPYMGPSQLYFQAWRLNSSDPDYQPLAEEGSQLWTKEQARLSPRQAAIFSRLAWPLGLTNIGSMVYTRAGSALRLQSTAFNGFQVYPVPDNYWPVEVSHWFESGLARLQQWIVDYAAGPSSRGNNDTTWIKRSAYGEAAKLCQAQLTRDPGSLTINFSVLALGLIYGLGVVIIVSSYNMERLSELMYFRHRPEESFKRTAWDEDGFLQLQKRAFTNTTATTMSQAGSTIQDGGGDDFVDADWKAGGVPVTKRPVKIHHYSNSSTCGATTRAQTPDHTDMGDEDVESENWPLQQVVIHAKTENAQYVDHTSPSPAPTDRAMTIPRKPVPRPSPD